MYVHVVFFFASSAAANVPHDVAHGHYTALSYAVGFAPVLLVILGTLVLILIDSRKVR